MPDSSPGHAYGKSLRTVKSCVGSTWCRYGVQDSTTMAILLEERYRGLRSPHKLKLAVSGCARECAEAQSKDVGRHRHREGVEPLRRRQRRHAARATPSCSPRTSTTTRSCAVIDRFLMYYVRTGDRLERTSAWIERIGGIDHVRDVVLDDPLGLAAELEADMATHVDAYECEWRATLEDPDSPAALRDAS